MTIPRRPRPAQGRLADPERTRKVVARLHGLSAAQAALLTGDTLDEITAQAQALAAGTTGLTKGGTTFVDSGGTSYSDGTAVDGGGREMVREAFAQRTRRHTHVTTPTPRTAITEDKADRHLRIAERLAELPNATRTRDRDLDNLTSKDN